MAFKFFIIIAVGIFHSVSSLPGSNVNVNVDINVDESGSKKGDGEEMGKEMLDGSFCPWGTCSISNCVVTIPGYCSNGNPCCFIGSSGQEAIKEEENTDMSFCPLGSCSIPNCVVTIPGYCSNGNPCCLVGSPAQEAIQDKEQCKIILSLGEAFLECAKVLLLNGDCSEEPEKCAAAMMKCVYKQCVHL